MFEKSMLESIAQILGLMAAPPNLRSQPLPDDLSGVFTQWFDGGAINMASGYSVFEFNDGSRAFVPTPFPHIFIQLASGEHLSLSLESVQVARESVPIMPPVDIPISPTSADLADETAPSMLAMEISAPISICPRCGHDNGAGARFCSECGTTSFGLMSPPGAVSATPPSNPAIVPTVAPMTVAPTAASSGTVTPPALAPLETIPPAADKKCRACGLDNKSGARFCRRCGNPLA